MPLDKNTDAIKTILELAGRDILDLYGSKDYKVEQKPDHTQVTTADLKSEEVISSAISSLFPGIPVISEETAHQEFPDGILPADYWILDPLDGTLEFIKGNGEFCICLARISAGEVTEGYILAPVASAFWFAIKGEGAYRIVDGEPVRLPFKRTPNEFTILKSRSHSAVSDERWIKQVSQLLLTKQEYQGSAIKFCRLAEGSGDIYIKFGVINKWDVAAGALILEEGGGAVNSLISTKQLLFNSAGFSVEPFLATGYRIDKKTVKSLITLSF